MKMTHLMLSAIVALPLAASAQNTEQVDRQGMPSTTEGSPASPTVSPETSAPDTYKADHTSTEGMDRQQRGFHKDVQDLKRDIEAAMSSAGTEVRGRFESLRQRADSLEQRIRESWTTSKKALKDEYKDLKKEYKVAKKEGAKADRANEANTYRDRDAVSTPDSSVPPADSVNPGTGSDRTEQERQTPPSTPVAP